tara:strand:- start:2524 stop:3135 length:612 start_codon:yes stop_codon:yes gene_type:complete
VVKPHVIILLHGFNSLPGAKAKQIAEFIAENHLGHKFELIAPKLDPDPRKAVKEVNKLIRTHKNRKVHLIGTSLGGFYACYFRAKFKEEFLTIHAINPSWTPSKSLTPYANQVLENFKSKELWKFKETYLLRLEEYERYIQENLKTQACKSLYLHISNSDEILKFDKMLNYLDKHKINYIKNIYDTDHRFRNIKEVMKLIVTI